MKPRVGTPRIVLASGRSANGNAVAEPVVAEPVVAEPVVAEPAVAEPVVAEPVVAEPAVAEPAVAEPAVAELTFRYGGMEAIKARNIERRIVGPVQATLLRNGRGRWALLIPTDTRRIRTLCVSPGEIRIVLGSESIALADHGIETRLRLIADVAGRQKNDDEDEEDGKILVVMRGNDPTLDKTAMVPVRIEGKLFDAFWSETP
jgi:hypothetical protein